MQGGNCMVELLATRRSLDKVHGVKKLRRMGKIPCILYGGSMGEVPFMLQRNEVEKYILRYGQYGTIKINIDGESVRGVIKEVQRHVPLNRIIHMDLKQIDDEECLMEQEISIGIYTEK